MRDLNLSAVDLNLLVVVATVLEERSATRAAAKLNLTQPAVSNALRRASALFDVPLVQRAPHGLVPTPRGAALLPRLRAWLDEAHHLLSGEVTFDPATSNHRFRVACSDAVTLALLPQLLRGLRRDAPGVRLTVLTLDRLLATDGLERGEVDLLIGIPPVVPAGHDAERVYVDALACLVCGDRATLSLDEYAALPHVELALFGEADDAVDRALAQVGRQRTVAVALPHFSTLPLAVKEIDGVATVAGRLARAFAAAHGLRVVPPPIALAGVEIRQVWHRRTEHDPAAMFLRAHVREVGAEGIVG